MRVGLDEFPDSEAIRRFPGGDRDVLAHNLVSLFDSFPRGKTVTLCSPAKNLRWDRILPLDPRAIRGIPENIKS